MDIDKIVLQLFNYGVPSIILVIVSLKMWELVQIVIKNNKDREDKLMAFMTEDIKKVHDQHILLVTIIHDMRSSNDEAHQHQRKEHEEFMEKLRELN